MHADNFPKWDKHRNGFYEVWYLKLNLPGNPGPALWLRFTTLSLKTGLKKVAETWAIFFDPSTGKASSKIAVKNTATPAAYDTKSDGSIWIEDCIFAADHTSGTVVSRGHRIEWDLKFTPNDFTFFHVPEALIKLKLTKSIVCKPNVDIAFDGWFKVNEKRYECNQARGCQGHIWGTKYAHDWAWGHCNIFDDQTSETAFEALTARVKLGGLVVSPRMSAIFFQYKGQRYELNHLAQAFSIRSDYSLERWIFSADQGPLRLSGEFTCDIRDLAGITYEDTNGRFLYCNNTELASLRLAVYLNGKLDATLTAKRSAAFETVSSQRSSYVEVLL